MNMTDILESLIKKSPTESEQLLEKLGVATKEADGTLRPLYDVLRDIQRAARISGIDEL